jgi:hypothetical protein
VDLFRPSLTQDIVSASQVLVDDAATDPLDRWFALDTRRTIRAIEQATYALLVDSDEAGPRVTRLVNGSDLACFFYIGLFNVVRAFLAPLRASNPTWIKTPKTEAEKITVSRSMVVSRFKDSMSQLAAALGASSVGPRTDHQALDVQLGNSTSVALPDSSVASVLTSPPYCTRIDYAVATAGELALLGVDKDFRSLRDNLMGTATIGAPVDQSLLWGPTCLEFLERVHDHPSKASSGYYYKSHCQYFDSLYKSLGEVGRVLTKGGLAALVVQNSHYKEVLNDLPQICIEMGESHQLGLYSTRSFPISRSFTDLNTRAKKYAAGDKRREWEEVVVLKKHS